MNSLTARIDLDAPPSAAGAVVITNSGSHEVRVWRVGNRWGDEALSFELTRAHGTERIVRKPLAYTVNLPVPQALPPGGEYAIRFDLGDGTWQLATAVDRTDDATLVAIYEVAESSDTLAQRVWTGQLRSAPVRIAP